LEPLDEPELFRFPTSEKSLWMRLLQLRDRR